MNFEGFVDNVIGKASDKGIEEFRNAMHNDTQISKIRKAVKEQLSIEKKNINENSTEGDFSFEVLSTHIENYMVKADTIDNLLSEDKACRESTIHTIIEIGIEESHPKGELAKGSVRKISISCIQRVYSFFERELDLKEKYIRMTQTKAVNEHTDERLDQSDQHNDERFDRIDQGIENLGRIMQSSSTVHYKSDNKAYLELFNKKLFLDEDCENVTLQTMYVEPGLVGEKITARTFVKQWYQKEEGCLLLYGDAGIGKSSFVSKLVSDECQTEENLNEAKTLAITLRDHCDEIKERMDKKDPIKEILKKLYNVEDLDDLQGKVLILDGYDELTVLIEGFKEKAPIYIESLCTKCKDYHFKVIITSREGYFDEVKVANLIDRKLIWDEHQVDEWCNKYKANKPEMSDEVDRFYSQYKQLPKSNNDERYSVLCVPFILYLCCNSGVDLNNGSSIVKIYNSVFRKLLLREHSKGLRGFDLFGNSNIHEQLTDEQLRLVFWQYTKEIAYQMFLLSTLNLSNSGNPQSKECIGLTNAKKRTVAILKEWGINIAEEDLHTTQYLSVFTFSKPDNSGGISFVHKTVYDFFTAVKLYEDYFAEINFEAMQGLSDDDKIKKMLNSTIEAFRYHNIPKDILGYICEINDKSFLSNNVFSFSMYEDLLIEAAKRQSFSKIGITPPIQEYHYPYAYSDTYESLSRQINQALTSAMSFLTGLGFRNDNIAEDNRKTIAELVKGINIGDNYNIDLHEWHLDGADLRYVHLELAELQAIHLENAEIEGAHLTRANLAGAYLNGARMKGCELNLAVLSNAHLENAQMAGVSLRSTVFDFAKMRHVNLKHAVFDNTCLNYAHLENAYIVGCYIDISSFEHAYLYNAYFTQSYLKETNMQYAHLKGANFEMAYFLDVDLSHADLRFARFEGANLKNAKIFTAKLKKARYDKYTVFPDGFDPKRRGMIFVDNSERV